MSGRSIFFSIYVYASCLMVSAAVGAQERAIFAGIWSDKDRAGADFFVHDKSWDQFVSIWRSRAGQNQYLADVEVYRLNGRYRYAGVWRTGGRAGALMLAGWNDFVKAWKDRLRTQALIDLEIVGPASARMFLGVWRVKRTPNDTSGGMFTGLTWAQLSKKFVDTPAGFYLADVETYVDNGQRLFAGVWRRGTGNGGLHLITTGWPDFLKLVRSLRPARKLIDFEVFQTGQTWNFLGVWRVTNRKSQLRAGIGRAVFKPLSAQQFVAQRNTWRRTKTLVGIHVSVAGIPPLTSIRGDTACSADRKYCNACATDVRKQFLQAFAGRGSPVKWKRGSWKFRGDKPFDPDNLKPETVFKGRPKYHIQGLVRTNSLRIGYAGSHSHGTTGTIFFIERRGDGNYLHSIYKSADKHPSGVTILGNYLFVAEKNRLRRFTVNAVGGRQNYVYRRCVNGVPGGELLNVSSAGGGLGLARLKDGTTLLVVSERGAGFRTRTFGKFGRENAEDRYTAFYRFVPNAFTKDACAIPLGKYKHPGTKSKPADAKPYSENLSVVTECGTGHIYTIHTTGKYRALGNGYWRLSSIRLGDVPFLKHVVMKTQKQRFEYCHHRSSATVRVGFQNKLEFLCSERRVVSRRNGEFNFLESDPY